MTQNLQRLVVVGHGAAGLAAALAAAEQSRSRGLRIDIALLEKSREAEAGGNTRCSPSYMRLDAPERLAPGFEDDMQQSSGGLADAAISGRSPRTRSRRSDGSRATASNSPFRSIISAPARPVSSRSAAAALSSKNSSALRKWQG